uniref:RRM domain-containing protein n=1 Tax=Timema bartmani TaxID=61472 RepID=A0A7R9HWZ0_9NEOP|nr:unnamed protein product [Timema bartmani]
MSSKRRSRHDRRSRSSSSGSSRSRSHSQSSEEAEGVRLHVADLEGMGVSKHELQYVFDKYGPLKEIWVAKSPPCFAFVVFRDREDAEDALRATDGITSHGTHEIERCQIKGRISFLKTHSCKVNLITPLLYEFGGTRGTPERNLFFKLAHWQHQAGYTSQKAQ